MWDISIWLQELTVVQVFCGSFLERSTGFRSVMGSTPVARKLEYPSNLCHCPNFQIFFYLLAN